MIISLFFRKINAFCVFCQIFVNFWIDNPPILPYDTTILRIPADADRSACVRGTKGA
ncbi:hypothetical protein OBV_27760 [Oscillibacter valericigenes Sjm18-20]|nr:hypothetical protein OBV_27760 [Oscillibacter valericigenes Sjm18-20]